MTKNKLVTLFVILLLFIIAGYLFFQKENLDTIVIGTKDYTEEKILGYLIADVIEINTDYKVKVLPGMGQSTFLQEALKKNQIDIYVDYTSTAYEEILHKKYAGETSDEIYQKVNTAYNELFDESWISLLGYENSYTLICENFCVKNDIKSIEDLSAFENYKIGGKPEDLTRSDGLPLLEKAYGLKISANNKIGLDHSLIFSSLDSQDIDLGFAYTTDGRLKDDKYLELWDTKNVFAKYDAGIIVNNNFVEKYPQIGELLKKMNKTITYKDMQKMNYDVEIMKKTPQKVAKEFSEKHYSNLLSK